MPHQDEELGQNSTRLTTARPVQAPRKPSDAFPLVAVDDGRGVRQLVAQ